MNIFQVRVAFLSHASHAQQTKRVAQHRGSAHKVLNLHNFCIMDLSDGVVIQRQNKVFKTKEEENNNKEFLHFIIWCCLATR